MPKARATVPSPSAKASGEAPHERILSVARELFCRDGIHATGIDRILAEAGASKMTLYARFGSKQALLGAVLREESRLQRTHILAEMERAGGDPAAQLRRVVPALRSWFLGDRFYGCALMNAAAEHAKGEAWLRALAAEHGGEMLSLLQARVQAAGHRDPSGVARQIMLLIDGAIAAFMVSGDPSVIAVAERTMHLILSADEPERSPPPPTPA